MNGILFKYYILMKIKWLKLRKLFLIMMEFMLKNFKKICCNLYI